MCRLHEEMHRGRDNNAEHMYLVHILISCAYKIYAYPPSISYTARYSKFQHESSSKHNKRIPATTTCVQLLTLYQTFINDNFIEILQFSARDAAQNFKSLTIIIFYMHSYNYSKIYNNAKISIPSSNVVPGTLHE